MLGSNIIEALNAVQSLTRTRFDFSEFDEHRDYADPVDVMHSIYVDHDSALLTPQITEQWQAVLMPGCESPIFLATKDAGLRLPGASTDVPGHVVPVWRVEGNLVAGVPTDLEELYTYSIVAAPRGAAPFLLDCVEHGGDAALAEVAKVTGIPAPMLQLASKARLTAGLVLGPRLGLNLSSDAHELKALIKLVVAKFTTNQVGYALLPKSLVAVISSGYDSCDTCMWLHKRIPSIASTLATTTSGWASAAKSGALTDSVLHTLGWLAGSTTDVLNWRTSSIQASLAIPPSKLGPDQRVWKGNADKDLDKPVSVQEVVRVRGDKLPLDEHAVIEVQDVAKSDVVLGKPGYYAATLQLGTEQYVVPVYWEDKWINMTTADVMADLGKLSTKTLARFWATDNSAAADDSRWHSRPLTFLDEKVKGRFAAGIASVFAIENQYLWYHYRSLSGLASLNEGGLCAALIPPTAWCTMSNDRRTRQILEVPKYSATVLGNSEVMNPLCMGLTQRSFVTEIAHTAAARNS